MASADLLRLVRRVKIETRFTPPMVVEDPFEPGPPSALLQFWRPRLTVEVAGTSPVVLEPGGPMGESSWPLVRAAGYAIGAVAVVLIARHLAARL